MKDLTFEEVSALIEKAKNAGLSEFRAKGVHFKFASSGAIERTGKTDKRIEVSDVKVEDIFKPISPLDDLSPEEILYYATPHFDTIQAEKEAHKLQLKEKEYGQ